MTQRHTNMSCPLHNIDKTCNVRGCNAKGHSSNCSTCGNRRRASRCQKHKGHTFSVRQKLKRARKSACERCGGTNNLTVHHIDENRYNNHKSNLMTLCRKCHDFVHGVRRRTKIERWVQYRWFNIRYKWFWKLSHLSQWLPRFMRPPIDWIRYDILFNARDKRFWYD
jgi:hypothetical protein